MNNTQDMDRFWVFFQCFPCWWTRRAEREKDAVYRALGGNGGGGAMEVERAQGVVLQLLQLKGFREKKFEDISSLRFPFWRPSLCYIGSRELSITEKYYCIILMCPPSPPATQLCHSGADSPFSPMFIPFSFIKTRTWKVFKRLWVFTEVKTESFCLKQVATSMCV